MLFYGVGNRPHWPVTFVTDFGLVQIQNHFWDIVNIQNVLLAWKRGKSDPCFNVGPIVFSLCFFHVFPFLFSCNYFTFTRLNSKVFWPKKKKLESEGSKLRSLVLTPSAPHKTQLIHGYWKILILLVELLLNWKKIISIKKEWGSLLSLVFNEAFWLLM